MTKVSKPRRPALPEYFIFEIGEMKPNYILSVEHDKYRDAPYREFSGIDFEASCVFPKRIAGRNVSFNLMGQRDFLVPAAFKRDSSWKPRCVGALEIKSQRGHFYLNVPHESLSYLTGLLISREARFVLLYGEPLSRGMSLCSSFQLEKTINLEDY